MALSCRRASKRPGVMKAQVRGLKASNAASKAAHFASITLEEKPALKIRRVIAERMRSSGVAAMVAGSRAGVSCRRVSTVARPPLRVAAIAMMSVKVRIGLPPVRGPMVVPGQVKINRSARVRRAGLHELAGGGVERGDADAGGFAFVGRKVGDPGGHFVGDVCHGGGPGGAEVFVLGHCGGAGRGVRSRRW